MHRVEDPVSNSPNPPQIRERMGKRKTVPLARTGRYCVGMRVASLTGGSILI